MRSRGKTYLHVWWNLCEMSFASQLSTRMASVGYLAGKLVRFTFFLVFLFAIFQKIPHLHGYTLPEVVLFFMTFNLVDVLAQFFFRGIYGIKAMVRDGGFDRILAQPINPLFRVSFETVDLLDLLTLIPILALTYWTLAKLPGSLTLSRSFLYIILVGNGVVIAFAIHVFVAALAVSTQELDNTIWVYRDIMALGRFPVNIYAETVRVILTYLVPIAVMTSFPAQAALGLLSLKGIVSALAIAALFLGLSRLAWRAALRRYTSVSS